MRQEVRRKSSRAASELEDRPGLFKICVRYKIARRYIFIERLPVLQRTEPIVKGSDLFSRQHLPILTECLGTAYQVENLSGYRDLSEGAATVEDCIINTSAFTL